MAAPTNETPVLDLLSSMTADSLAASSLDDQTLMLVRIAALAAVDAPPVSYLMNLEAAADAGVDADQIRGVLAGIAPIVGTARVASATVSIVAALDVAIEVAELDEQSEVTARHDVQRIRAGIRPIRSLAARAPACGCSRSSSRGLPRASPSWWPRGSCPVSAIDGFLGALLVAAVVAALNAVIPPVLAALRLPATLVLGFLLVLFADAGILLATDALTDGILRVDSFGWALLAALVVAAVSVVLAVLLGYG